MSKSTAAFSGFFALVSLLILLGGQLQQPSVVVLATTQQVVTSATCLSDVQVETLAAPQDISSLAYRLIVRYESEDSYRLYDGEIDDHTSESLDQSFEIPNQYRFRTQAELSPDGSRLFQRFTTGAGETLITITDLREQYDTFVLYGDESWDTIRHASWLDQETLLVPLVTEDTDVYRYLMVGLGDTDNYIVETVEFALPDIYGFYFTPSFNPNLTRVVYAFRSESDSDVSLALWDIHSAQIVDMLPIEPTVVKWSPIGSLFAAWRNNISSIDLFVFDSDGLALYQATLDAAPSDITWSPDEQYLAYQVHDWDDYEGNTWLQILNLESWTTTDLCLPSHALWSPDSNYIAISIDREPETLVLPRQQDIYIYDVQERRLYKLNTVGPVVQVLGWVAEE